MNNPSGSNLLFPNKIWNAAGPCALVPRSLQRRTSMRKVVITLAALAAFGIALPAATISSANAETVIIKKSHRDHGHHYGWRNHRARPVVSGKKNRPSHHRPHGASVVIR